MITHLALAKVIDDCVETYRGTQLSGEAPKGLASTLKERIAVVLAADDTEVKKQLARACLAVRCVILDAMKLYHRAMGHDPNILIMTKQIEEALALDWQLNMAGDSSEPVYFRKHFPKLFGCKPIYGCRNFDLGYEEPLQKGDKLYCVDSNDDKMVVAEYQETRQLNVDNYDYKCISEGVHCWLSPVCWHRTDRAAWEAHERKLQATCDRTVKEVDATRRRIKFVQTKIQEHAKDGVS